MSKTTQVYHPVNIKVGGRIHTGRKMRGLSQKQLGEMLPQPITFQQIQKYEKGRNRISLCLLCDIAKVLQLPLVYFLEDLEDITINLADNERQILDQFRMLPDASQHALLVLSKKEAA